MSTTTTTETTVLKATERPFDFGKADFEGEINVGTEASKPKYVAARMRKPSHEELIVREREATFEARDLGGQEIERLDNSLKPSARLFDKVVTETRGYRLRSEAKDTSKEFRTPSEELLKNIPSGHKARFIDGMYIADAVLVDDDDDFAVGGEATLKVDLIIGRKDDPVAVIRFELPEPQESERERFTKKASQLRENLSAKTRKLVTNLKASIEFFVDLMSRDGASVSSNGLVNGVSFQDADDVRNWASQVDPMYMQLIIGTAFARYNAKLRD